MAFIRCKGTNLQLLVGNTFTTIAQMVSQDLPDMEGESFEADTLDNANAGIPYKTTGRTEGGSAGGEFFLDPALSIHQSVLALLTTPTAAGDSWKFVFADSGASEWTFTGAGVGVGGAVALNDGLKGNLSIKLDGLPTFP